MRSFKFNNVGKEKKKSKIDESINGESTHGTVFLDSHPLGQAGSVKDVFAFQFWDFGSFITKYLLFRISL